MARWLRIVLLIATLAVGGMVGAQGNILVCTAEVPPQVACTYERVDWQIFGLEATTGVQVQLDLRGAFTGSSEPLSPISVTPFLSLGLYQETVAYWVEIAMPEGLLPVIGSSPYAFQLGFEYRW